MEWEEFETLIDNLENNRRDINKLTKIEYFALGLDRRSCEDGLSDEERAFVLKKYLD